jgi:hypothetical protein
MPNTPRRRGGLVPGMTLLAIGLVFMLANLDLVDISVMWPLVPIFIGVAMILRYFLQPKERNSAQK